MSLTVIAHKEIADTHRSYTLIGTTVLFTIWASFLAIIQWVPTIYRDSELSTATLAMMNSMQQSAVVFVPFIGLMLGYAAIVYERTNGSYKLLLSLPHTRSEFVFGKFLGRTVVLWTAISVSYATAAIIAVLTYSSFSLRIFLLYTLFTLLYGAYRNRVVGIYAV